MRSVYHRACSYAFKCNPLLSKDLVHEAWLRHYQKEETDLFEKDIFIVLRWIKNIWFAELRKGQYMKNGEMLNRHFLSTQEEWSEDSNAVILPSKSILPDQELISKEFYQELFKRVDGPADTVRTFNSGYTKTLDPAVLRRFLELLDLGYKSAEICEEMNISPQRLHYYKKKLQKIINEMEMKSPFNGDNTRIKKKITRKTFETNDEYKEYKYDPDQNCDRNEFYEIVTNGTDFILIREKND